MLKRRVLERDLRAEGVEEAGCGSVIKVESLPLPCAGPQESVWWAGPEAPRRKDSDGQGGRGANSFSLAE